MVRKIFLSHSSKNKEFIDSVYQELPPIAIYDKYSFHTGDEFVKIINQFLQETSLFVLFASQDSLNAPWVSYEIDKAIQNKIQRKIDDIICVIIDDSSAEQIPELLRPYNIYKSKNPKDVALEIKTFLDSKNKDSLFYFGRNIDAEKAEKILLPINSPAPQIVNIYGLPGIGKKTFFRESILNIEKHKFSKISWVFGNFCGSI